MACNLNSGALLGATQQRNRTLFGEVIGESEMDLEVRYHMMRPEQVVERRRDCPVAYIPIGNLEWHGVHNPMGSDTLQAEGLAIMCAQKGGGLVFPPLYYGESRLESLMEATSSDRGEIARGMELSPDNFSPQCHPFGKTEQVLNYQKLLIHILAEAESLGFELGVLVAGHYPLIDHARSAVLIFNQRHYSKRQGMLAWAFVDYLLINEQYPEAGDHAGGWETSHLLALHPDSVELDALPPNGEKIVGTGWSMDPRDSNASFGRETLEAAAEIAVRKVKHRLENKHIYRQHGCSLQEGLWKEKD